MSPISLQGGEGALLEDHIQALVHAHPRLLPIAEIDPIFVGPVPVCRELTTPAGNIDNFMVTPTGLPVLVECKMWRNAEARREVVGQILDYACGAGALQAVLAYYGVDVRGDTLIAALGTNDEIGTRWWEIVRVAKEHGLEASSREHMTEHELARHLDQGEPVLMPIQAWLDEVPPDPGGWAGVTEWGHYVVAVGYDAERFYFEDPAMFGVGYIPRAELEARWHDFDEFGTRLDHFGIAFRRPQGPDALASQIERIE